MLHQIFETATDLNRGTVIASFQKTAERFRMPLAVFKNYIEYILKCKVVKSKFEYPLSSFLRNMKVFVTFTKPLGKINGHNL